MLVAGAIVLALGCTVVLAVYSWCSAVLLVVLNGFVLGLVVGMVVLMVVVVLVVVVVMVLVVVVVVHIGVVVVLLMIVVVVVVVVLCALVLFLLVLVLLGDGGQMVVGVRLRGGFVVAVGFLLLLALVLRGDVVGVVAVGMHAGLVL